MQLRLHNFPLLMINCQRLLLLSALSICTSSCFTIWRGFDFYAAQSLHLPEPTMKTQGVYLSPERSYSEAGSISADEKRHYLYFFYDDFKVLTTSFSYPLDSILSESSSFYTRTVDRINKNKSGTWGEYKVVNDSIYIQYIVGKFGSYLFYSSWVTEARGKVYSDSSFTITSTASHAPNLLFWRKPRVIYSKPFAEPTLQWFCPKDIKPDATNIRFQKRWWYKRNTQ